MKSELAWTSISCVWTPNIPAHIYYLLIMLNYHISDFKIFALFFFLCFFRKSSISLINSFFTPLKKKKNNNEYYIKAAL